MVSTFITSSLFISTYSTSNPQYTDFSSNRIRIDCFSGNDESNSSSKFPHSKDAPITFLFFLFLSIKRFLAIVHRNENVNSLSGSLFLILYTFKIVLEKALLQSILTQLTLSLLIVICESVNTIFKKL